MDIEEAKEILEGLKKLLNRTNSDIGYSKSVMVEKTKEAIETIINNLENSISKEELEEIFTKEPANDPYVIKYRLDERIKKWQK